MDEKIIIKSKQYNAKKILFAALIIGAIALLCWFVMMMSEYSNDYDEAYATFLKHNDGSYCRRWYGYTCGDCKLMHNSPSKNTYVLTRALRSTFRYWYYNPAFYFSAGIILLSLILYLWLHSYELVVTDKRVFGRVAWGKRVDLPVDSVSSIATVTFWKGISVSTSSGRIRFLLIKNVDEIYNVINNLLIARQKEHVQKVTDQSEDVRGTADEIKKFKELLDGGIITQEEFDAKKKQLLGI